MRVLLPVLALALTIYALLDCARTPEEDMPARMPKFMWIALIVVLPPVGSIAWIIVSRVKAAEERGGYVEPTVWSSREGTTFHRPERPRPMGPDDDPDFLRSLETDLRRQRRERQSGKPGKPGTPQAGKPGDAQADAGPASGAKDETTEPPSSPSPSPQSPEDTDPTGERPA